MAKQLPVCLGSLHDDLLALANKVYAELAEGDRTVWADGDAKVYVGTPEQAASLSPSWLAGTFSMGRPVVEIADDLRELLRERAREWITD